ncbi:MAG TPA: sulfate ABC transporter substrate-binding protein [Clostridium sp.]|nr:sulfate ABC transporter substrate-binding protein [Clostridium sp.]
MKIKKTLAVAISSFILTSIFTGCGNIGKSKESKVEIINVSYDPTRELYEQYNEKFREYWKEKNNQDVEIIQSHGGSGAQARSVIEGIGADVVSLALDHDITAIQKEGLIEEGWKDEFPLDSAPYTSTIVFLVRKGNEKNIKDWNDIVKKGVNIITPNPKSSGGACWSFLAAWAYADKKFSGDEIQIKKFMADLYNNVSVLGSGARGATTTFVENGQGDVLISWENEAYLAIKEHPDEYEIISPSVSILAQPSVAAVDQNIKDSEKEEVAKGYIEYLYSDVGQRIAGDNYYRPTNAEILKEYSDIFNLDIDLVNIDDFGGWDAAYDKFFKDGGIFDEIYVKP